MGEVIYFEAVVASKRYPGGHNKFLIQAESMEEALKNIKAREGEVEENGVWVPKGAVVVGLGGSGYSGVLLKKPILTTV